MLLAAFLSLLILAHYPLTPSFQPVTRIGGRSHDPIPPGTDQQDTLQNGTAHGEAKTDVPAFQEHNSRPNFRSCVPKTETQK